MRCDEVRGLLDDYADGVLAAETAARLDDHLAGCPGCAGELRELRQLLAAVAGMRREIEPSRDLWPGVASRLPSPPNVIRGWFGGSWRWRLAAAAVVVVAAGSLLIAYSLGRRHAGPRAALAPTASSLAVPAGLIDAGFAGAEADFMKARDELLAALDARRGTMSPQTRRVVDDNLKLIDDAIDRISAALVEDPANPRLANRLAEAYRTQIEFLQRANRLPAEI